MQEATCGRKTLVDRLSKQFAEVFETQDSRGALFSEDALFDLNMPAWRFQLRGPEAFSQQLKSIVHGEIRIELIRTVATGSGFVAEHEEHQQVLGQVLTARRLWLCEVRDDRIVEATCYCTGEWDEALRARHAREAPMIRS